MSLDFHVIIPARLQSSRLPGKLMMEVGGVSILEHVYRKALLSKAKSVTIAVDHQDLYDLAKKFGAEVVMTASTHASGTDRLAEAALALGLDDDALLVNVQGDEPQMPPLLINQVASVLAQSHADLASLYWPIERFEDFQNPSIVKVVFNQDRKALYFSRTPIPFNRDAPKVLPISYRHIGLYSYRMQALQKLVTSPVSLLEQLECLEQLRALHLGFYIQMAEAMAMPGQDINTLEDLELFKSICQ